MWTLPPGPIKTTDALDTDVSEHISDTSRQKLGESISETSRQNFGENFSEQQKHSRDSDTEDDEHRVTAVMAVMTGSPDQKSGRPTSNKQVPRKKIIKILLDSGSDGDLLFQKKEQPNTFPTRLGRCQSHGARRMGFSKRRGKGKSKSNSLNTVTVRCS